MHRGVVPRYRWLLASIICAYIIGCTGYLDIKREDRPLLQQSTTSEHIQLSRRILTPKTGIWLVDKHKLQTLSFPGAWIYTSADWICLDTRIQQSALLSEIRINDIDPRAISTMTISMGGHIRSENGQWIISGRPEELRYWLKEHGRQMRLLQRRHLGLQEGRYIASIRGGGRLTPMSRLNLTKYLAVKRNVKIGWRWQDVALVKMGSDDWGDLKTSQAQRAPTSDSQIRQHVAMWVRYANAKLQGGGRWNFEHFSVGAFLPQLCPEQPISKLFRSER